MHEQGWARETIDEVEKQYKGYLHLLKKFPTAPIVPSEAIDEFWHTHILDTRKYMEDCDMIFGTYLHHFPYFGIRGPEDAQDLQEAFDATKNLFMNELGISLNSNPSAATCNSKCSSCSGESTGKCYNGFIENIEDFIDPALIAAGFKTQGIKTERPVFA